MPQPVGKGQRYLPGLDGLRAIAVAAVVAFHLGLGWASGGLLGVGVFFTLSGYLITDILVGQWRAARRIDLKAFWVRRARRLLPALFTVLAVVAVWVSVGFPAQFAAVRGAIVAAALYVSNWWFIAQNASYFARFGPPSPVEHLWSLAVEEQFYLLWPWVVFAGGLIASRLAGRGRQRFRVLAAAATVALAAASFIAMAVMYHPGVDPTRIYEGTDTRAGGLLIGAALAIAWPTRRREPAASASGAARPGRAAAVVDACGVAGLLVIGLLVWRTTEYSGFLYDGGMALLSVATALVILAVVHPASRLARVLGAGPLRWLGVRSYGIYLWHYPIIVLTATGGDPTASPLSGVRQVLVAGSVVAVAAVSWALVEDPVRRGRWPRAPRPVARAARDMAAWAHGGWPQAATAATMALGIAGVTVTGGIYLAGGLRPAQPAGEVLVGAARPGSSTAAGSAASGNAATGTPAGKAAPAAGAGGATGTAAAGKAAAAPPAPWYGSLGPVVTTAQDAADARLGGLQAAYAAGLPEPLPQTSCQSVVHIGDSTSDGLISSDYLPDPKQRVPARYQQVGVRSVHMEVVGGTSIVEEYDNKPNAYKVAQRYVSQGYKGCWVIALGTNDTADVAVGSNVGLNDRIAKMMSVIGNQPVLWLTVKSRLSSGPYAEKNMQEWDQDLYAAAATHPNMKVYDWASVVQGPWFISDQIHFTSAGYAARGELIADALAAAFPAVSTAPARSQAAGNGDNANGVLPVFMGGNMPQLPRVAKNGNG